MYRLDWLSRWGVYSAEKTAIDAPESGRRLTYGQLNRAATHLAAFLAGEHGLKRGDRVAVLADNHPETFVLFGAAQKSGIILVPLNVRLTPREVAFLIGDARPALVIAEDHYRPLLADIPESERAPLLPYTDLIDFTAAHENRPAPALPDPGLSESDPVFILYTSGTTGFPKGALYTHKMLLWNSINTHLRLHLTGDDHTITCLPLFHTGGWNVLSTPFLHHGASFSLTQKFDPDGILELLERTRATLWMGVPTMLKLMAESPRFASADLSSVRYFLVGGEAMPIPLIERWHSKGVPIRQGYGLTEVGPNITSLHQDDATRKIGSIGLPNFYVETMLADDGGNPVAEGESGELLLRGPMTTPGYWENPDATAAAFHGDWFRTGDVVSRDEDGYLTVVDRKKNMYISGGENVYPAEVEHLLHQHPAILEAAVIGVPDPKWGETGKAFVVVRPGETLDAEAVLDWCRGKLAKFKQPRHVAFLAALPKGDTGKIDRKRLRALHDGTD